MKTIIQDFPTIYGEPVNGSVFGQPNGSIARPPQNTSSMVTLSGTVKVTFVEVIGTSTAKYSLTGLSINVNIDSYARMVLRVKNASEETVCSAQINSTQPIPATWTPTGDVAKKPTDGDALTVTIILIDGDAQPIASNTIAATAEVPAE